MGLVSNNNRIFLGVADGKITQSAKEDTAGAVKHVKDGKISYRLIHDAIEGILTNISIKENEYNGQKIRSWVLTISDMGLTYQLELSIKGGYGSSMIKALANPKIDFSKPLKFSPWAKTVNNKQKTAMYVSQSGDQIDWFFTKETPNGLPEPKKVMFEGTEKWDWYDQLQFLEKYAETKIKPAIQENQPTQAEVKPTVDFNTSAPEDDYLPF